MQVFFSAGEPSGDQHTAHLIHELQRRHPGIQFRGFGGPLMQQAGCQLDFQLTDLAVMGVWRVLPLLWKFIRLVRQARRIFHESPPDAVVLVDFPGFNWWIARKAHAAGIPVLYYLPPQLWAWASYRVKRMQKYVDHVLCALPFETQWYAERNVQAQFVGHPFFDEVKHHQLDQSFLAARQSDDIRNVGILPGSRTQEVTNNWPIMLQSMREIAKQVPNVRFRVACYKPAHRELCVRLQQETVPELRIEYCLGQTPEIIELSECCLMVSGSVSLELLARTTPAVVIYQCSRAFEFVGRKIAHVGSITLPNLISGRVVLPEFLVVGDQVKDLHHAYPQEHLSEIITTWLTDAQALHAARNLLVELREQVSADGATGRAAQAILDCLAADNRQSTATAA